MTRAALALALSTTLALPAAAGAEPFPPPPPPHEHHELAQGRRELHDDLRDAERADWLLREYDKALGLRGQRGREQVARVEDRVALALEDEVREAGQEAGHAEAELRRDRHEVRDDRPDLGEDPARGGPGFEERRAHQELRDDRRAAMMRADYLDRISAIRAEWARLEGDRRPRAVDRKRALLAEVVRLARFELREDRRELREDGGDRGPGDGPGRWREGEGR